MVFELDSLTHRPSFTLVIAARSERRESGVGVGLTHSQTKFHTSDSSVKLRLQPEVREQRVVLELDSLTDQVSHY